MLRDGEADIFEVVDACTTNNKSVSIGCVFWCFFGGRFFGWHGFDGEESSNRVYTKTVNGSRVGLAFVLFASFLLAGCFAGRDTVAGNTATCILLVAKTDSVIAVIADVFTVGVLIT